MLFASHARPETLKSLSDVEYKPFWLDDTTRPEPAEPLSGDRRADLVIVGAGFTGLWAALLAKEADPSRDVVLLEGDETANGASGRNGGFMDASLTHGFPNGLERWPAEIAVLTAMGRANLDAIQATIARLGIDCNYERNGELTVATEAYQLSALREMPQQAAPYGEALEWLDQEQLKALVDSPIYLGALYDREGVALVDPARLAWGLRRACLDLGVHLYEHTPVTQLEEEDRTILVHTPHGRVRSNRLALATNAYPPVLRRMRRCMVPIYDYVLVSEPLSAEQHRLIGWGGRQGIGDAGNQFHYYRQTSEGRILWGGYDAVYYWNNGFGSHLERNVDSFARLAEHFFQTFPQLQGLRFTHAWGGAIDTCSRFSVFWGVAHHGHTVYALGYTGLGVGAARFGAQVMLELLDGVDSPRTRLEMARTWPIPFPPEPLRSVVINLTRRSMNRADRNQGQRDLWLRVLDRLGLGFDS
jgi:glycine/D-amino acid oxidase-like deaminating enzyme